MADTIASVSVGQAGSKESITVSSTAIGFTVSKILVASQVGPVKASKAEFKVETDSIRFTEDGSTPTSTVGLLAEVGDVVTVLGKENVERFKAIRVTTDATIQPIYSR